MSAAAAIDRTTSYGEGGLSLVDRLGVWLSRRAIVRAIGNRQGLEALDLGCGYHASLLRSLRRRLARGLGVDLRVSPIAGAEAGVSLVEATLEEALPHISDGSFDLVLLISVLEHLWEPLDALREIRRVLRPGGVLLVNVPTWRGKAFLEFSAFRLGTSPACEMDDHKTYYDIRDLWPLLVRAGFCPRDIQLKYHKLGLNLFGIVRVPSEENLPKGRP
jgi:SAM-dependent methyltransferase